MFREAVLNDIQARAIVHMNTDYKEAVNILGIRERAEDARDGGVISADECDRWIAQLDEIGRAGRFFMSTNHYVVCGRKAV